jgi:DNA-binding CsgD family transcriptional regulator
MDLVGRHEEEAALGALLAVPGPPVRVVVIEGPPGVGKTSLWARALALGEAGGARVLLAHGSEGLGLPFGGVVDLFADVAGAELSELPPPQREALDVALYRALPGASAPDPSVLALALLSALRLLAARQPLLVAVDDVQWLDDRSQDALAYATRRLRREPITFVLTRRGGRAPAVERSAPVEQVYRLEVGPLSLGAIRQVLLDRLGLRLPHHLLRRVNDATSGNPLFAIEVGRLLAARDLESIGAELPVPEHVEELLGLRVGDLDDDVRRLLVAVSLEGDLTVEQARSLAGVRAFDDAVGSGIVEVRREHVRAGHPLLAEAARRQIRDAERAEAHRRLAAVVPDEERRVLHLALATSAPDEALATRVEAAARLAAGRGATRLAVDLSTHALRLTPPGRSADARVMALAQHLHDAGEKRRLTELLAGRVESLTVAADRVSAHLLLAGGVIEGIEDMRARFDDALRAAGPDPVLRGRVLANRAVNDAVIAVTDVERADSMAAEAAGATAGGGAELERFALYAHTWTRVLRGGAVSDLAARFDAVEGGVVYLTRHPLRVIGQQHVWRGELAEARVALSRLRDLAEARAQASPMALARLHLCELELRAGSWVQVGRIIDEWTATTDAEQLHWPMYERCRALLAAGRGAVEDARRWGAHGVLLAEGNGGRWDWLESRRALGTAALLAHDLDSATEHLGAVWQYAADEGVVDPGVFPAGPDLVEALVGCGELDRASSVVDVLAQRGAALQHPWATVGAQRGRALVHASSRGYDDDVLEALTGAAAAYDRLGLSADVARTWLSLGRLQRRARKWGAARTSLQRAVDAFTDAGAPGWADEARSELDRVGGRRPVAVGALSRAEHRVAELAAKGLSNKEIARALSVTVHTVEFHLGHVYAKLGVRSRVQLAAHFLG